MIPKVINYIWLGNGKKSKLSEICIHSWYEKAEGYEIKEWSEQNLDLDKIASDNRFFRECRKRKLWAFMADYLRLKILYENGGVYFDTDIQLLKDLSPLLNRAILIGYEKDHNESLQIGTGVIGCEKGNPVIKSCLDFYEEKIWSVPFYTIPRVMACVLKDYKDIEILPYKVLTPFSYCETFDLKCLDEETYTIHWFEGTWSEKMEIRVFMRTKHIKNPFKRKTMQIAQLIKFLIDKISK